MPPEVQNRGISGPIKGYFPLFFFITVLSISPKLSFELQSPLNRYGEVAIYKSLTQGGPFIMSQFLCSIPTGMGQLSRHVENMTAA